MNKTAFAILLIAILIVLSVVGVIAYASDWFTLPTEQWGERFEREDIPDNEGNVASAAQQISKPDNFVLPANYTAATLEVTNNLNDFSFELTGCYAFDISLGQFNFRVYRDELNHFMHYIQIDGYTFDGFSGWTRTADGSYYEANYTSLNSAALSAIYTPKTFTIVFTDGVTNNVIQTLTASYGSEVKAPNAPDYSEDGLIFVGWEGGDFANVNRNATIYSVYAPARYITCIMPDGSEQQIVVAEGSSLADAIAPPYENEEFSHWLDEDGEKIDATAVTVERDMTLEAVYSSVIPEWAETLLIVLGSLIGAALIITIVVHIVKRKVRKAA